MVLDACYGRAIAMLWMTPLVLTACVRAAEEQPSPPTVASQEAEELIKCLDSKVKRRNHGHDPRTNGFERVLKKLIRLGSAAEDALELKLKQDAALRIDAEKLVKKLNFEEFLGSKEADEIDRVSNNLELLTALRRVQNNPDPLSIEVV